MKPWRWMLALLVCSAMVFALGLTGCGDDDDEVGSEMTCEDAFDTLTSDTCVDGGTDAGNFLQACVLACDPPGNEACVGDCVLAFLSPPISGLPPACANAIGYLTHDAPDECRECYVPCREAFLGCVLSFAVPVEDCSSDSLACLELCP